MHKEYIYLDNAATEPLHPAALEAMRPFFKEAFFNADSPYDAAYRCRAEVERARREIAGAIGAAPEEIYFTSGSCEANSWAIQSLLGGEKKHILTMKIEHHSVLGACAFMREAGFSVNYLPVDRFGRVDPDALERMLTSHTALVSVMLANNEIGTVEPVEQIAEVCARVGVPLHTDAVQALSQMDVRVDKLGVHLLSASAHKFGGPKGVGFLYAKRGYPLRPLIFGGAQERGKRGGTSNAAGIVGMAAALRARLLRQDEDRAAVCAARDAFLSWLCTLMNTALLDGAGERIPGYGGETPGERVLLRLNGHPTARLPGNLSLTFFGVNAEALMLSLERRGVLCSAGAACSSSSARPSHVLQAIGLSEEEAASTLRFSFSPETTLEQALTAARHVAECALALARR